MPPEKAAEDDLKLELEQLESEKSSDVEVENPETPPVVETKVEEKPAPREIPVDAGIQALKEQLEEEKRKTQAAEIAKNKAIEAANTAKGETDDTNLRLLDTAIETAKSNQAILKQRYREAAAAQDYDAMAEINTEQVELAAQQAQLKQGKIDYERKIKEAKDKPKPIVADPVEALASQLNPRGAAWVREHPEYARSENKFQELLAAHNLAISRGAVEGSDDYYNRIEATLEIKKPVIEEKEEDPLSSASKPSGAKPSPPAAPVSRAPAGNSGNKPNVVRLTAAEREIAAMNGMTDQEYAKQKLALMNEGKLNS